jgi:putative acetyltransferase
MRIRLIENTDNVKIATVIRSVIIEMGVPKVGTAYEDVELDNMFQAYQKNHFVYYVVEDGDRVLGGAGIAPLKIVALQYVNYKKCIFFPKQGVKA